MDRSEKMMMDYKPHRLKFLPQLGVPKEIAETYTIQKSSKVIKNKLTKIIGKKPQMMDYYKLWTHGVSFDALKDMTLEQVQQMLQMIWSSAAYQKMYPRRNPQPSA